MFTLVLGFLVFLTFAQLDQLTTTRLHAKDWRIRQIAARDLERVNTNEAQEALIGLLGREEQNVRAAFGEGTGAELKWGEEYVTYVDELTQAVADSYKKTKDPNALPVLLRASYNPRSVYAYWLADQGEVIIPELMKMLESGILPLRESAVAVMGHLLKARKANMSPRVVASLRSAFELASHDSDPLIRIDTAVALGEAGDNRDLGLLKNLAEDKTFDANVPNHPHPVREAAEKAIHEIEERQNKKR